MRILALDTATEACSVAVQTADAVHHRFEEVGRGHAELILPMVSQTLAEAGISLEQLDGLAASVGPGSFTGVRISVSVAQGLAFGARLPVVAVTTLEALAQRAVRAGATQVLACLDARMGEVYWGCFAADAARGIVTVGTLCVGPAESVRVPFAGEFQALGRGLGAYPSLLALPGLALKPGADQWLPDARDVASLGAVRLMAGEGIEAHALAPQYLRDKVALTEIERSAARADALRDVSDR
jgi:tRNA threonylcarbamoyladenosine biosynthesis protein TsaB